MNAEPLYPLPKQRDNDSLKLVQLLMLFLIWSFGTTIALLLFFFELVIGARQNAERNEQNKIIHPLENISIDGEVPAINEVAIPINENKITHPIENMPTDGAGEAPIPMTKVDNSRREFDEYIRKEWSKLDI